MKILYKGFEFELEGGHYRVETITKNLVYIKDQNENATFELTREQVEQLFEDYIKWAVDAEKRSSRSGC